MASIIIVGGGLSGLSAAHTVLERGGRVVIVEKNPFLGGNSTKATSGINGALTKTQVKLGIKDSKEQFYDDTAKSARDLLMPELVEVLTHRSASAVDWLQEKFNLDLSLVSRLGGHSQPRTHRGKEKFPGMTITYALMERLEDMAKSDPNRVRVVKKARVQKIIQDKDGTVTGVEYEKQGKTYHEMGPVILATGGFAADFAANGLLKQYRPEYYDLPTTNGDWSTGDGIKMVRDIGGKNIMMEMVQVHPTGLVDPQEPDAKVKFLAAEALRGVGGLLLTNEGLRFADELGHRDYVTGQMWKTKKAPYRLVLNGKAGKEIEWHCKHYMGRGLMKHFASGKELAKEMGISVDVLNKTFEDYNSFAKNKNDPFGKKYFHNLPFHVDDEFWVSIVTPVLHYCMGGLEINKAGEVLSPQGVIKGLFASGEVVGGVHGANRLGGSSLLGCVVFGRLAGDTAANYAQAQPAPSAMPQINLSNDPFRIGAVISHQGLQTTVSMEPNARRMNLEVLWTDANGTQVALTPTNAAPGGSADTPLAMTAGSPAESPEEKVPPPSHTREITIEEVAKHNKEDDCWVVVNGLVLDVTKFLADHPGGKKAILIYAGKDATDEFNMLHKPDVVDKYAPETVIGKLKGGTSTEASTHAPVPLEQTQSKASPATPAVDKRLKTTPSNKASLTSGGTADILPMERKKASFDVEKMTNVLDGGPDKTKRRRFILSPNKGVDMTDKYSWDAAESLKQHMKHFIGVHEAWWDTIIPTREEAAWMSEYSIFSGSLMNHYGLFLPTIEVHSSEEQRGWWSDRARRMQIIGCYAQTELGHGSNVRGLQTTATYDKKTQQFVLHTPTLSAMKWWPGTLGKVATHALVYAQLIIDGQEYGVHSFMVQIRDENHMPLPGIELGDLGPKLGDHANDTGYMIMNNIRIPRQFMLARYQSVSEDGVYAKTEMKKQNSKLHYSTMIFTRGSMVRSAGGFLAKAATIATRYSCVRKQGFVDRKASSHKAEERQIIDYQMQRYRVFKQVALAYAVKFTGSWMLAKFSNMETKDHKMTNLDSLPEIAATSGALKSLVTFQSWSGIEDLRKCCGGNGYLMSAGVAPLAANYVWQSTAEGDWILLMLHTAQFLLKALQGAVAGNPLTDIMSYLKPMQDSSFDLHTFRLPAAKAVEDLFNLDYLLDLFKACALIQVASVGEKFSQRAGELGGKFEEAFNDISIELVTAVRAHCVTLLVSNFINTVRETQDQACRAALTNLCALYCCSNILDEPQWTGVIDADMVKLVKSAVPEIMQRIRPDAVALVDAFDIPDNVLCSNIGRFDGNVYEALYESAKKAPLNQREVFLGYEYLQPHLDKDFLKTKNALPPASLNSKAKTGKL